MNESHLKFLDSIPLGFASLADLEIHSTGNTSGRSRPPLKSPRLNKDVTYSAEVGFDFGIKSMIRSQQS